VHVFANGLRGIVMTNNERKEPRSASEVAAPLRARIARYRKQAADFTRLAAGERNAAIHDRWVTLAREGASSASELESWMERPPAGRKFD
jgi:hypothetical protein